MCIRDRTYPVVLSATVANTQPTCNGTNDGSITISNPSGGYGTYDYSIDGGATWTAGLSNINLAPGTYDVQIRDAAHTACVIDLGNQVITYPVVLSATVANTQPTCNGTNDGSITISNPSGGYGTYDYSIDGGATWTAGLSNIYLAPVTYDVQIRDAAHTACVIDLGNQVITYPVVLSATVANTQPTCNGTNDGSITISNPTGGYGTYDYSIDGGATWTAGLSNPGLAPGTYDVQIRDAAHTACVIDLGNQVITYPVVLSATVANTQPTCNGTNDGSITISNPSGGYGTYDYSIDGGATWTAGLSNINLAPGTYDVQIRDAAHTACVIDLGNQVITYPVVLSATVANTQPTCNGTNDGSITISNPSGGYGTYDYSIDGGATWTAGLSNINLAPGTYDVQIRDAAHTACVIDLGNQVITYPVVLSATVANTQPTCNGTNDGSITISNPSGGYGTYDYSIDGGATWTAGLSNINLAPGTYDVQIRDAAHTACVIDLGNQVITYPVVLSATVANTQPTCNGTNDGSITISNPTGGYGTYDYSIDGGATWTAGLSNPGLAPGTYDVQIRDAAHTACVIDLGNQVITYPVVLSATVANTQPTCNGTNDGSITISNPSGGYGTYDYSIDGGATWTAGLSNINLAPGTYDVQIRDAAHTACVIDLGNQVITYPVVLSATVANTQPTCNGTNDGSITISNPSGGYGTYDYSIDGGATWTAGLSNINLAPGTYDVQIRDAAHTACVIDLGNQVITYPVVLSATVANTQPTCNGTNDGSITISNPSGGYGTYDYSIDGGATWTAGLSNINLAPGTYDVQIRDAAHTACVIDLGNQVITYPVVLSATVANTQPTCNGTNDGSITISNPSGGYGTYDYSIDGGATWTAGLSNINLAPGTYDVQIRDAAHTACVIDLGNQVITYPVVLSATVANTQPTCNGTNDGSITISNPSGGYGTYDYSIDGGATWTAGLSNINLAPGTYDVQIRDAAHTACVIDLGNQVITYPVVLSATVANTQPTCNGTNDGSITISNPSGGYGTYDYSIDGGATWTAGLSNINLAPGTYDVQIRDAAHTACVIDLGNQVITYPVVLSATVANTQPTCNGTNDGSITISNPSGGYGTYDYSIDGGATWTAGLSNINLAPGTYDVQIRDAAHTACVIDLGNQVITYPVVLSATVANTQPTCNGTNDGSITISNPSGGYGTYDYSIDGGATWTAGLSNINLAPGTYDVQIRDAAHTACVIDLGNQVITYPVVLSATVANTQPTCNGTNDGSITISNPSGGYGTYDYSIDGGATWTAGLSNINLAPGTYDVQIRDAAHTACVIDLGNQVITYPVVLSATVANTQPTCNGTNDGSITISNPSGGYGTYDYSIDGGATWTAGLSNINLAPGTYDVQIRDAAHTACVIDLGNQVITYPVVLSATVANTQPTCNGTNDGSITISNPSGGYGTYDYSIDGGATWTAGLSNINLAPGTYDVQIRDAAHTACVIDLGNQVITYPVVLSATVANTQPTCNGTNDGSITISNPSGGYGTYDYSIDGGATWTAGLSNINLAPGTYDVQIRDAAHTACVIDLGNQVITYPVVLSATVANTQPTCNGTNDGSITISNPSGGYGTYDYSIDGGATWTAGLSNIYLAPVTYDVQIRDAAHTACVIDLGNQVITYPVVLSATVANTQPTCNGTNDGSITISNPTGGYGTYDYSIDGGATWTAGLSNPGLAPGTYDVQIRDAAHTACVIDLGNQVITYPVVLSATVANTQPTCNGTNDGSITISNPSGGYGTYDYSIDGGATWTAGLSNINLAPGTYDVQIRDAAHTACVIDLGNQVITYPVVLSATVANTQPTCNGTNDGSITISNPSGGYGTYDYSIDGGATWTAGLSNINLAPGTYDVQIRDAAHTACVIDLGNQVITYPVVLSATVANTQPTCNGTNDGSITISNPSGGYGTYDYSIDGGATWTAGLSNINLAPGTYDVQIRDAAHTACVIDLGNQVITYPVVLSATVANTQPTCNGTNDGSITISNPSGGYGTYDYSIDGGATWTAGLSNIYLAPVTYDVQIRDAAHTACVIDLGNQVITYPVVLSATVANTQPTCNGTNDGSITISNPTGGYGTYDYSIDGGATWTAGLSNPGLAPGTYDVQIRDAAHTACVIDLGNQVITYPVVLSATVANTQPTCNGTNDGSITISNPTGGYGTYDYSIDGGATWTAGLSNIYLAPVTYDVQIRDAAHTACVIDLGNQVITYPVVLSATVANTQPTCNGTNDGSITISNPTGGYGTYDYSIDGGATWTAGLSNPGLAPGTYDVQIRDAAHTACVIDLGNQVITYPVVLSATVANTQPTCNGTNDGSITISNPTGGYGTYDYSIDGGATWTAGLSNPGLAPGTYDVQIRDAAHTACVIDLGNQVITYPVVLSATVANTQPTCNGTNDGSITISNPSGGYGTYDYSIDGGATWTAGLSNINLAPGTYDVQIRDAAHTACVIDLGNQVITYPVVLSATVANTQPTCNGTNDGSITISNPSGGYGTYDYSIDGGATWTAGLSNINLAPGTYDVQIRDAAHTACVIDLGNQVITYPVVLSATVANTQPTCNGTNDGSITISNPSGGYGTYDYSIDGGATWTAGLSNINLAPGTYDVQIRDAAHTACVIDLGNQVITYPVVLSATVANTQPTCNGTNDGSITISNPSGGYGTYDYSIDGGATWTAGLSNINLAPGTYDVQIRDAAHTACVIDLGNQVITYPVVLSATVANTQPTCNGTNDGSITISNPSGGYGTYDYSIDGGATWTAGLSNIYLAPVTYDVQIRDAAHTACVIDLGNQVITYPVVLSATVANTQPTCNGTNDGSITISNPSGGYGTYDYSIDGGATWTAGLSNINLAPGTYDVQIRDAAHTACVIDLGNQVITYPVVLSATVANTQPTCNGTNDGSITISNPSGGYGTYDYSIDGGATWTAGLSNINLAPGTYDVQIRDAAHTACVIDLGNQVITYPVVLSATVANTQPTCNGTNDGSITISNPSGGYGTYDYSIDGGATWTAGLSNINLAPGTYDVQIRDAAHTACVIDLGNQVITYPVVLSATVANTQPTCNGTNDGSITISNPTGGYGTYDYSIDGGATWTAGLSNPGLAPGTYDVQIRDAAHTACVIDLGNQVITYPVVLSATVANTQPTCNGTNDGSITISNPSGGYGTYDYSIDGGATWTAGLSNPGLAPGTYDVQIRDAAHTACVIDLGNQVITYPVVLSATVANTQPTCNGTNDGSITISNPSGGYGT